MLRTLAGHRRNIDNLIGEPWGRLVSTAGDSVSRSSELGGGGAACVEIEEAT